MRKALVSIALLTLSACNQSERTASGSPQPSAPVTREDADLNRLKDQLPGYWASHMGKGPQIIPTVYDRFQIACAVDRPTSPADQANGVSRVVDVAVAYVYRQPSQGDAWQDGGTYDRYGLKGDKWWLVVRGDSDTFDRACRYGVSEWMGGTKQAPIE